MTGIEQQLRNSFGRHADRVVLDRRFFEGVVERGERRVVVRRRRRTAAALTVLLMVGVGVGAALREQPRTEVVTLGRPGSWTLVEPDDPAVFDVDGDLFVSAVTPWRGELLTLGVVQLPDGTNAGAAWVTSDGADWQRAAVRFPDGCSPHGGVAVDGDRLVIGCQIHDGNPDGPGIGTASTVDLTSWQVDEIADTRGRIWFGVQVGPGPDGVVAASLEGVSGDTTRGATMRIWSVDRSGTSREIVGASSGTFLDTGSIVGFAMIGDTLVASGQTTHWPVEVGPGVTGVTRPAIWVSNAGAPFERMELDPGDQSGDGSGVVTGIVATLDGHVAVGSVGDEAIAWISDNLKTWTSAAPISGVGTLWEPIALDGGRVLATDFGGSGEPVAWFSTDSGRTWQSAGPGPGLITSWGQRTVGISQIHGSPLKFWVWDESR